MQMMDAASDGNFKALWAIGYDVLLTNANAATTRRALRALDFLVVQDLFLNETAKESANVFFPAASSFEKDGTFMNGERRVQRVRKIFDPPGQAKPDWEIICALAWAMGKGDLFNYDSAESIWNEVRKVWKAGSGISYERIEQSGLQWPCPEENHPGTTILHRDSFPVGKKAALRRIPYEPTPETTSAEFPFLLTTGRTLYHFNAGTMTLRTANVELYPGDFLDIAPADVEQLNLADGDTVRLRSRHGEVKILVRVNQAVKPGELFATFHTPAVFLNQVTSPHRDRHTLTPEYKVTAVRIEKL
jgi:formate dehydrogenase major subunit